MSRWTRSRIFCASLVLAAVACGGGAQGGDDAGTPPGDDAGTPQSGFVTVDPSAPRFLVDGEPYYFAGTNLFWLVQRQAYGDAMVAAAFDAAQAVGLRVIRIWGFADGAAWTVPDDPAILQPAPGVLNEEAFVAMDAVLAEAGRRGLKVIVPLVNYWDAYGGMPQYAAWAGGEGVQDFYGSSAAQDLYLGYVEAVLGRRNTITGVVYRDDPTIFSWEIANEARAPFDPGAERGVLVDWYREVARFIHAFDPNHLVATGEEGYDVPARASRYSGGYVNTEALSGEAGSSFIANTSLPEIDYGGAHLYGEAWGWQVAGGDGEIWISDHVRLSRDLGKPFVLGEWGNPDRAVYTRWVQQIETKGVAGSLLWELEPSGIPTPSGTEIVYPDDTDLVRLLADHAARMNAK